MLYGFERMLIEGLRQDSLWLIPGAIRVSQLLSLLIVLATIAFILLRNKRAQSGLATLGSAAFPLAQDDALDGAPAEAICECGCASDCDDCEKDCETILTAEETAQSDEEKDPDADTTADADKEDQ
jgi:hypothetical protein